MKPAHLVILALSLGAAAGSAWLFLTAADPDPALVKATVLPEPRALGAFELRDARGEPVTGTTLQGEWHLLFFGFANCPDICPVTLQQLAAARRRLGERADADLPRILFISVDPERDSPDVLAAYASQFGDGVRAATAAPAALRQFADELGIFFQVAPGEAGDYEVSHSAAVLLLNRRAELAAVFAAPHSVDAFVHDLPIVMARR